jgi:hypothetical protein
MHSATFAQQIGEGHYAIVDNTIGGYVSPYDISETGSAKPQGS